MQEMMTILSIILLVLELLNNCILGVWYLNQYRRGEIMSMNMKFKELKPYISVIDRISMCTRETLGYENYSNVSYIPENMMIIILYGWMKKKM